MLIKCPVWYFCRNNNKPECTRKIVKREFKNRSDVFICKHFESTQDELCRTCNRRFEIDTCYDCEPYDNMLCLYRRDTKGGA